MRTIAVALVTLAAAGATAQEPKPSFEVASIKRNTAGEPGFGGPTSTAGSRPTGYSAINTTLSTLMFHAYGFDQQYILGGPGWVRSQRYDIEGRGARQVSRDLAYAMLRTLLEERFKLVVAKEQRMRDAYTLKLARPDGRLGPDLHRAADDCDEKRTADRSADYMAWLLATFKSQPRPSNGALPSSGNVCATIDNVAGQIGLALDATVIDETGLTGRWDFVIARTGLQSATKPMRDGTLREYPSVFIAVQEQLGLKVERRREPAPFDVLVIKSVEQPSEN